MDSLDLLTNKVHLAAQEIIKLKQIQHQLRSELEIYKLESEKLKTVRQENEKLNKERIQLKNRLENLNSKIEKMISLDMNAPTSFVESTHE